MNEIKRSILTLAAGTLVLVAPAALSAQELPDARTVLDRWAEAIGGEEAWLQHESLMVEGTMSMPAVGMEGPFRMYQSAPGRHASEMEIPGYGKVRTGFDGETAWNLDPMSGPRILDGDEARSEADAGQMHAELRRPEDIRDARLIERIEMNGEPCYAIEIVRQSGRQARECFHTETYLRVASTSTSETPAGTFETTTYFEAWQEVGNLLVPARQRMQMPGNEIIMVYDHVELDTVDPAVFELPAEIRALQD